MKRLMIRNNLFAKIQNLVANDESRRIKSNPDVITNDLDKLSNGDWDGYFLAQTKIDVLSNNPAQHGDYHKPLCSDIK